MIRRHVISILSVGSLLFVAGCTSPQVESPSVPAGKSYVERGHSLVMGLASCGFCHGSEPVPEAPLSGGRQQFDKFGAVDAPNITPAKSGLASWSPADVITAVRSGRAADGSMLSQEVHRGYEWMSDEDALSVAAYLRALPPVEKDVARRTVDFVDRNTTGFFEKAPQVRGYTPAIAPRFQAASGKYLVDHVARCGRCHDGPAPIFGSAEYLAGGRTVRVAEGEKEAPGITSSEASGLGLWSEGDIIEYLRTGKTPDNRFVDPQYCPVGFYRNASSQDLLALAKYLKTVPASE